MSIKVVLGAGISDRRPPTLDRRASQDAEQRILNGKSDGNGKTPLLLPSAIFHSTSGRTFSAAC
jgi:hypothetical protein